MMDRTTPSPAYLAALRSYLRGAAESALLWAYEYGRAALDSGAGVLELGAVHRDAVAALMADAPNAAEAARIHRDAWAFHAEIVAPVEMALRGYQQSNDSLRSLAATLDEQVRARTRDLDGSLEELKRADNARKLLLERLMSAQEDERRRIAGDIHDDSIQVITAAYLRVDLIRQALGDDRHAETLSKLDEALRAAIDRLRHLIFELRPAMLDTVGLAATIRQHLDQWAQETGADYTLEDRLNGEPGALPRTTLYRIASEALSNVRKHARATHVAVDLEDHRDGYLLRVADNGIGLGRPPEAGPAGHFGLSMMVERAAMSGGWCRVESSPGRPGTTVVAWMPGETPMPAHERSAECGRSAS
ncbi:MAG TPA: histidine kinase [Gaiellales bacterium]|nr:histidine kinase [Gaiellales bacterium]